MIVCAILLRKPTAKQNSGEENTGPKEPCQGRSSGEGALLLSAHSGQSSAPQGRQISVPIRPQTLPMSAVPYKVFSVFLFNLHYYPHSQMIKGRLGEEKTLVLGFAKSGDLLAKHLISALPDFAYVTCGCGHHIMGQMSWEQQRCKTEQRKRDQHPRGLEPERTTLVPLETIPFPSCAFVSPAVKWAQNINTAHLTSLHKAKEEGREGIRTPEVSRSFRNSQAGSPGRCSAISSLQSCQSLKRAAMVPSYMVRHHMTTHEGGELLASTQRPNHRDSELQI